MRKAILMVAAWLCLFAICGVGHAEPTRDPFESTPSAAVPLNYEGAIQQITVKGIVRTQTAQRVIVSIAGIDGLAVLKAGDKVSLDYQGRAHVFLVEKIAAKAVGFRTLPKAVAGACKEVQTYEVIIR